MFLAGTKEGAMVTRCRTLNGARLDSSLLFVAVWVSYLSGGCF